MNQQAQILTLFNYVMIILFDYLIFNHNFDQFFFSFMSKLNKEINFLTGGGNYLNQQAQILTLFDYVKQRYSHAKTVEFGLTAEEN